MNVSHLAVIVPVDGLPQDMEEASQEVWGTVTHLLLPTWGNAMQNFIRQEKHGDTGSRRPLASFWEKSPRTGFCVSILRRARRRQRPFISM